MTAHTPPFVVPMSMIAEDMDDFDGFIIRDKATNCALFTIYSRPNDNGHYQVYQAIEDRTGYDMSDEKMLYDNANFIGIEGLLWTFHYYGSTKLPQRFIPVNSLL